MSPADEVSTLLYCAAMSDARRLTIYEPFRSMFYAPQFVALYGRHFAAEGLDVEAITAGAGDTTTAALLDGRAEIALGGIMRSLDVADRGGPFLVHFAEVNSRNGFFCSRVSTGPTSAGATSSARPWWTLPRRRHRGNAC